MRYIGNTKTLLLPNFFQPSYAFRHGKRGCCVHYGNVVVQQSLSAAAFSLRHALASR